MSSKKKINMTKTTLIGRLLIPMRIKRSRKRRRRNLKSKRLDLILKTNNFQLFF